jgi:DNA-directed RNA polymerase subunit F
MDRYQVTPEYLPQLVLQIHELTGNQEKWLNHANLYYKLDALLAEKLMQHYMQENRVLFQTIAKEVFDTFPYKFDEFLAENLKKEEDLEFYKIVLLRLVRNTSDLDRYRILKEFLTEKEKESFYAAIYDLKFLTRIYQLEERPERILQLAQKNFTSWDFDHIIVPILQVYPRECMNMLKEKIFDSLTNRRSRSSYVRIVGWIKLMQQIPDPIGSVFEVIRICYTHKPNLPALRDEFRKGGLV